MNEWNEGYFTASTYTYGYYRELSPTFQNFCLTLRGFDAPQFDYDSQHCELGYGQGLSVNIHAASTPGLYLGTDFNPAHAAHANKLCQASGSGAQLFDDSFEQFLERLSETNNGDGQERFDSISLHGIWSWISADNQKIIVEFIRRHLKPGGVVYNSYNCFPGWAPSAPLRELFSLYDKFVGCSESNTFKRVEGALKFADEMLKAKPVYARIVPELNAKLEQIKKSDHDYLAHEYLNRDWICMYFSEVAELLSTVKLDYACTAVPLDNIDQWNLSAEAQKFLNSIDNHIMREQARDYFVNQQFRKDLYIRGLRRLTAQERQRRLLDTRFVLLKTDDIKFKCTTMLGEVTLADEAGNRIIEYLRADNYRPKRFDELVRKGKLRGIDFEQIIVLLTQNNVVAPCQSEEACAQVKPHCIALNEYLCRRAETTPNIMFLASPVIGAGYPIGRLEQILVSCIRRGQRTTDELVRTIWEVFYSNGNRLIRNGKMIMSEEENLAELKGITQNFLDKKLPILRALQIV